MKLILNNSTLVFGVQGPLTLTLTVSDGDPVGKVVSLTANSENAAIYYTTDGTTPTQSSKQYNSETGIQVYYTQTIKAIAYVGNNASEVVSQQISVDSVLVYQGTLVGNAAETAISPTISASVGTVTYFIIDSFVCTGNAAKAKSISLLQNGSTKTGVSWVNEYNDWSQQTKPIINSKPATSYAYQISGIKFVADEQVGTTSINVTVVMFATS